MRPQGRLPWRGGLELVALAIVGVGGCAPPCYDDGLLQGGCPADSEGNDGSGTAVASSGSATDSNATDSAESGMMSADGTSGSSGGPQVCPGLEQELTLSTRTFEFVVEQGDAMSAMFDGASRWSGVEDALVHPMQGAVTQRQSTTRFGLNSYHRLQAGCPILGTVPPQLDARDELAAIFGMETPSGSNPVADAVDDTLDELVADPWVGDKTIVLLMADEPSTCALPFPANALDLATTRGAAQDSVTAAFDAGFPTLVVSIDDGIEPAFLQLLANAGAGHQAGDPDATFFVVHDDQELAAALEEILDLDRPCSFALDQALGLELVPGCTMEVNGAPVSYDDPDGWVRPDEQTVELQGSACEAIQEGDATVEMVCNCDDV